MSVLASCVVQHPKPGIGSPQALIDEVCELGMQAVNDRVIRCFFSGYDQVRGPFIKLPRSGLIYRDNLKALARAKTSLLKALGDRRYL